MHTCIGVSRNFNAKPACFVIVFWFPLKALYSFILWLLNSDLPNNGSNSRIFSSLRLRLKYNHTKAIVDVSRGRGNFGGQITYLGEGFAWGTRNRWKLYGLTIKWTSSKKVFIFKDFPNTSRVPSADCLIATCNISKNPVFPQVFLRHILRTVPKDFPSFSKFFQLTWTTLREKCPNTELFLVRIFLHSDWIRRFT